MAEFEAKDLVSLRREIDYRFDAVTQRFLAQETAVGLALAAAKEAALKAELAQEKRFDQISEKIDTLTTYMDTLAGKSTGVSSTFAWIIAGTSFLISFVVFIINYGLAK